MEFDIVILVGISKDMFIDCHEGKHDGLEEEKRRINKDILYVALTRAISQLHIMGREKMEEVIHIS